MGLGNTQQIKGHVGGRTQADQGCMWEAAGRPTGVLLGASD